MKVLIAATPATGHLNPLLSIGQTLIEAGHEVVGLSAAAARERFERIGAAFRPLPPGADLDLRNLDAVFPERKTVPAGPQRLRFSWENIFIDPVPAQHAGLQQSLREIPADIIIADNLFLGVLPMLLGPRAERPPIVLCGTTFLFSHRDDGAPAFAGLPLAASGSRREHCAALINEFETAFFAPATRRLNKRLSEVGTPPLPLDIFDAIVHLPDAYLQLTVPGFEYPRRDLPKSVHFVGALPLVRSQTALPPWAGEIDGSRKVVLVTQGTLANHDFGTLIAPALAGLADESGVLVAVTCGGRPIGAVPGPIPGNARLASYLPFDWLLPKVDAVITNGGYGSVNQALSFGIPLVTSGLTEDKADVNARVAWCGAGIDLATNQPTPEALRKAVRAVLDRPDYRARAASIAGEFKRIDTAATILRIVTAIGSRSPARPLATASITAEYGK